MTTKKCNLSSCSKRKRYEDKGAIDPEKVRSQFPIFGNGRNRNSGAVRISSGDSNSNSSADGNGDGNGTTNEGSDGEITRNDRIHRKDPIFFDNAATTQKPAAVLRCVTQFYRQHCANAGRAAYSASTKAAAAIEAARSRVASFINAESDDLVFTSGATDSLNTVALAWGLANLKSGDEILLCFEDHKSAVLPWLNVKSMLSRFGIDISIIGIDLHKDGDYELESIRKKLSPRTRLIALSHVHHLYGLDMEVQQVREIVGKDVLISLDASQSIGHRRVDVKSLGVDFISFSGHKMFAANGVGVLWVDSRLHSQLIAIKTGGATSQGDKDRPKQRPLTSLLECGTPNIPSILSMVPAIDFIEGLGIEKIESRVSSLSHYARDALATFPGIEFAPGFGRCGCEIGYGIVSFRIEHLATTDLAFLLDSENMQVRTGDHCLSSLKQGADYARISLHVYNTEKEIDRLIEALQINLL
jgi:cysteine desulfurase/selenocysteine lyase